MLIKFVCNVISVETAKSIIQSGNGADNKGIENKTKASNRRRALLTLAVNDCVVKSSLHFSPSSKCSCIVRLEELTFSVHITSLATLLVPFS